MKAALYLTKDKIDYLYNCLQVAHKDSADLEDMADIEQSKRNSELYEELSKVLLDLSYEYEDIEIHGKKSGEYQVVIREELSASVSVEADNAIDALYKAKDMYDRQEVVLDAECYGGTSYELGDWFERDWEL